MFRPSNTTGRRILSRSRARGKDLNSSHSVAMTSPSVPSAASQADRQYLTDGGSSGRTHSMATGS